MRTSPGLQAGRGFIIGNVHDAVTGSTQEIGVKITFNANLKGDAQDFSHLSEMKVENALEAALEYRCHLTVVTTLHGKTPIYEGWQERRLSDEEHAERVRAARSSFRESIVDDPAIDAARTELERLVPGGLGLISCCCGRGRSGGYRGEV